MKCLIAGGGIAGLACSLSLARHGIESVVFEQREFGDTTGTGIQLSPNVTHLLEALPLTRDLETICERPKSLHITDGYNNTKLFAVPLFDPKNPPYYHVLRPSLVELLAESASKNPLITLIPETRVVAPQSTTDEVLIESDGQTWTGDVLIGCDGTHSMVKQSFFANPPRKWTGFVAYRAAFDSALAPSQMMQNPHLFLGQKRHVVTYPLTKQQRLNCVFVVPQKKEITESWETTGTKSTLRDEYQSWSREIKNLIDVIPEEKLFRWGLYTDSTFGARWFNDRVVLAGDACHTILPFAAQGAALAIEDVIYLSHLLATADAQAPYSDIFRLYERERKKRAQLIKMVSKTNQFVFHAPDWISRLRNATLPQGHGRMKKTVYSYTLPIPELTD